MIPAGHFESPYEFKPFKYSSHDQIVKAVNSERGQLRILDVGTASGYLGKIWREQGQFVFGVECDRAAAEHARRYYDAFEVADIESFDFPFRREFDYIVFADVLEHLRDPLAVLQKCLPALKESGKIIISIPNIANLVIRFSLLAGRFDYADRGILDRTHLHFYTLKSLEQLMGNASCEILDVVPTSLPFQIAFPFTQKKFFQPFHEILYALTKSWETLFGYQFVITAAPLVSYDWPFPREEAAENSTIGVASRR